MASTIEINPAHETLLGVIRRVRARWRLKLALRGAAIVLGALVVALLLGAYVMQTARFSPEAITGVRIARVRPDRCAHRAVPRATAAPSRER